jgi:hypothetical protein
MVQSNLGATSASFQTDSTSSRNLRSGAQNLQEEYCNWLKAGGWLFLKALPMLMLWLLIPLLLYLFVQCRQAESPTRELVFHTFAQTTRQFDDGDGSKTLFVAYPRALRLDEPTKSAGAVSVWLVRATSTLVPAPIPSPTPTIVASTSVPTSVPTPIPLQQTPTATLTPNPYVITLLASEGVSFVNKEGLPASSQIAVAPAVSPITFTTLYLRPALPTSGALPRQVTLSATVQDLMVHSF